MYHLRDDNKSGLHLVLCSAIDSCKLQTSGGLDHCAVLSLGSEMQLWIDALFAIRNVSRANRVEKRILCGKDVFSSLIVHEFGLNRCGVADDDRHRMARALR